MSSREAPAAPDEQSRDIAGQLAGAGGLLVGLDFDGTLAPIADDPDAPAIDEACRRELRRLAARRDTTVAVVSGRALADLRERVGLAGLVYAGNHGLELHRDGETVIHPIAARQRPALDRALDQVRDQLADVPGVVVEDKGLTGTVHVRRTPSEWVSEVRSVVATAARSAEGRLRVTTGREVFELRPAVRWDKGSAMQLLASRTPADWRTVYLGDDVTDEDAFRAIRPEGIGVLVGARDQTAATHQLPDRTAVASLLRLLTDAVLGDQSTTRS